MKADWDAQDYAQHSTAQKQWADELIAKLALRGNETVLDIGCGDGKISAELALKLKSGRVLGIDLSESMLKLAREQFPASKYPNLSFQVMNAADIHLPTQFDIAFSNAALHWAKDHLAILRGVRSCLHAGGKILFQMGGRGNIVDALAVMNALIQQTLWRPYFASFVPTYFFYGPEEYQSWLPQAGFRAVRIERIPKDMQHPGIAALKGWVRTTWFPYTHCLPENLRDPFLDEFLDRYIAKFPLDAQGRTHVRMARLEVEALAI